MSMPSVAAAFITVWPGSTSTVRPSIVSLGMSVSPPSAGPRTQMLLELVTELLDDGHHGHRAGVGEHADRAAHHLLVGVEDEVEVFLLGLAPLAALQHL